MSEIQPESITAPEKKIIFGKYEVGRLLGCGGFAKVYHGRDVNTGRSVAIKVMNKIKIEKSSLASNVKREISVMRLLRHPNIIRIIEVLANKLKIFVIMEFAKGGELFTKVAKGRFSEDLSRRYFRQLISAVGYCHSRGVFHRDLKPENLLLDENWNLKVSDFGLSAIKEHVGDNNDDMLHTLCGTPAYVAPEVLAKKGYYGAKIDVWSCGVILFVLTAGYLPFNDTNLMSLYRKIYNGEFKCPRWMSTDLKQLLYRLLDVNPDSRITIDEIIDSSWFKKGYKEVNFKFYDEDYYMKKEENNDGNNVEGGVRFLNAFDLICFSPGFSLGGLFKEEKGANCCETFLSGEKAEKVVETVEEVVREVGGARVVVERVRGGMGVRLEGQNGEFGLVVLVHKLTDELVLVEVRKRENNVGPSHEFWKEKLKPKICHLIHESNRVGSNGSLPGPSNRIGEDR